MRIIIRFLIPVLAIGLLAFPALAESTLEKDKKALQPVQVFVGSWKGVGQPRRGSTRGSWLAQTAWAWKFEKGRAALEFQSPKGKLKYFTAGRLAVDEKGRWRFSGTLPDGQTKADYTGRLNEDKRLILTADKPAADAPARISLRVVAGGDRLLVLFERRLGDTDRFLRLAEVGYTRQGSGFGKGTVQRECVVTGGAGTMAVTFQGQTYYVCCSGCRDYFYEDPAGVLAEYRAAKEAEKKKRNSGQ